MFHLLSPLSKCLLAVLAVGAFVGGAGATTAAAVAADAVLAERAGRVLQEVAAQADFNGAVVLMRDGQVVFERAVGLAQRQPDRPFTPDTPTDGGSLAKTLTAATLWELAAEGRLRLDDPVVLHLPEYPYASHRLRDLVSHRSGLPDYGHFDNDFKPGEVRDTIDLLRVLARKRHLPSFAPGVAVEYDNLGFDTAALVIERVTGARIEKEWQRRYFGPLQLTGMFARPARFADWPVPRSPGYQRKAGVWVLNDAFDGEAFIGASNVHASARDWARWGDAFARERVMPRDRLEAGLRAPMLDSGMDNRLNLLSWYCDETRQRCHYSGAYNGFYSQLVWDRTRREVVAFVSNSTLAPWRCTRLTRDLLDVLAGREPTPEPVTPARVNSKTLAQWAGVYSSPALGRLVISSQGGRALMRVGRGELISIFPVPGGVFYAPMLDLWLAFTGTPAAATLHLRSVFHTTEARREGAATGKT